MASPRSQGDRSPRLPAADRRSLSRDRAQAGGAARPGCPARQEPQHGGRRGRGLEDLQGPRPAARRRVFQARAHDAGRAARLRRGCGAGLSRYRRRHARGGYRHLPGPGRGGRGPHRPGRGFRDSAAVGRGPQLRGGSCRRGGGAGGAGVRGRYRLGVGAAPGYPGPVGGGSRRGVRRPAVRGPRRGPRLGGRRTGDPELERERPGAGRDGGRHPPRRTARDLRAWPCPGDGRPQALRDLPAGAGGGVHPCQQPSAAAGDRAAGQGARGDPRGGSGSGADLSIAGPAGGLDAGGERRGSQERERVLRGRFLRRRGGEDRGRGRPLPGGSAAAASRTPRRGCQAAPGRRERPPDGGRPRKPRGLGGRLTGGSLAAPVGPAGSRVGSRARGGCGDRGRAQSPGSAGGVRSRRATRTVPDLGTFPPRPGRGCRPSPASCPA